MSFPENATVCASLEQYAKAVLRGDPYVVLLRPAPWERHTPPREFLWAYCVEQAAKAVLA